MNRSIKFSLLVLAMPLQLLAQDEISNSASVTEASKPYEVVITGKPTRAYLRSLIEEVEDDFFELYSELNEDDKFDMYCYKYTPIMSHISKRACEPLFMLKFRSQESSNALSAMIAGGGGGDANSLGMKLAGVYLMTEKEMRRNQEDYYEILVQKMEELSATNRELGEIASVMEQLKYRLANYSDN